MQPTGHDSDPPFLQMNTREITSSKTRNAQNLWYLSTKWFDFEAGIELGYYVLAQIQESIWSKFGRTKKYKNKNEEVVVLAKVV